MTRQGSDSKKWKLVAIAAIALCLLAPVASTGYYMLTEQLISACYAGDTDTAQGYLRFVPVNTADDEGITPLIAAAGNGHNATVRFLLERGADPRMRDVTGRDALEVTQDDECRRLIMAANEARAAK